MMHPSTSIVLAVVFLTALVVGLDEIDAGLRDRGLVEATLKCLEEKGPCSKFGRKAKIVLGQIAQSGTCSDCSKEEQERAYDIIKRFRKAYPTEYSRLLSKYRPSGVPTSGVPAALKELAGDKPKRT